MTYSELESADVKLPYAKLIDCRPSNIFRRTDFTQGCTVEDEKCYIYLTLGEESKIDLNKYFYWEVNAFRGYCTVD